MTGIGLKPNASSPAEPATGDRADAAMVARARGLIPRLGDRAEASLAERRGVRRRVE